MTSWRRRVFAAAVPMFSTAPEEIVSEPVLVSCVPPVQFMTLLTVRLPLPAIAPEARSNCCADTAPPIESVPPATW